MHYYNTNVTLGNYSYFDNQQIGRELWALEEKKKTTGIQR